MKYFGNLKLHQGWELVEQREDGFMAVGKINLKKYSVISSVSRESDGNLWHHISVASPSVMPDYRVMKYIKANFMRADRDAMEIHAKVENHVNIHNYCRHLWCCLDKEVLPDFTHGSGSI